MIHEISFDEDILICKSNTKYIIVNNVKIRKIIIKGENIVLDLNSFTLYVKEITIEANNIVIENGKISNKIKIINRENLEIFKILSKVPILYKDVNLLIIKHHYIPPRVLVLAKKSTTIKLYNLEIEVRNISAIELYHCEDIHMRNNTILGGVTGIRVIGSFLEVS